MPLETLKIFGGAILLLGFFYFILIRAFNTKNYKRKSLYIFISGMIIFLFFVGGLIYDVAKGIINLADTELGYYAFLIVSFVMMLFFSIYYFVKGYKLRQKVTSKSYQHQKKNEKPTIKDKKEYLYIILKYQNNFLLYENKDKETFIYKGIVVKFPHNEFFHDELIKEYIDNNKLDIISYNYIGKATKREKINHVYYCYKIFLNSVNERQEELKQVDSYQLVSLNMSEMDKKILFTSVVENNFDIDVK